MNRELVHEDDEIITLGDLNSVETRELSTNELSEMAEQDLNELRQDAVIGTTLWYELASHHSGGIDIRTFFKDPSTPLDWAEIEAQTADQLSGTELELRLYTGQAAQRQIDMYQFYGSFFNETGTVATGLPTIIDPQLEPTDLEDDSLVTRWTKG